MGDRGLLEHVAKTAPKDARRPPREPLPSPSPVPRRDALSHGTPRHAHPQQFFEVPVPSSCRDRSHHRPHFLHSASNLVELLPSCLILRLLAVVHLHVPQPAKVIHVQHTLVLWVCKTVDVKISGEHVKRPALKVFLRTRDQGAEVARLATGRGTRGTMSTTATSDARKTVVDWITAQARGERGVTEQGSSAAAEVRSGVGGCTYLSDSVLHVSQVRGRGLPVPELGLGAGSEGHGLTQLLVVQELLDLGREVRRVPGLEEVPGGIFDNDVGDATGSSTNYRHSTRHGLENDEARDTGRHRRRATGREESGRVCNGDP